MLKELKTLNDLFPADNVKLSGTTGNATSAKMMHNAKKAPSVKMRHKMYTILTAVFIMFLLPGCEFLAENQSPTVEILSPENGSEFNIGEEITISAEASDPDGTIDEVRFYINDVGISSSASFPYNYTWNSAGEDEGVQSVKVTAIDNEGLSVSEEIVLILNTTVTASEGTFLDTRDSTVYKTIKIGNQTWMAENLAYLPEVSPSSDESYTLPKYYVYGYQGNGEEKVKTTNNYNTYGVLYNWPAAKNACPEGWHLPLDEEWEVLAAWISQNNGGYAKDNDDWESLGIHLKATSGWDNGGHGTDDYEFGALPAGERTDGGEFNYLTLGGRWWSATEAGNSDAYVRSMNSEQDAFNRYYIMKEYGFSVRCVKD